jgi:ADP-dependent NAD(P)H-hydrate dehydratase / NAD(P)H-hydrate epimerase
MDFIMSKIVDFFSTPLYEDSLDLLLNKPYDGHKYDSGHVVVLGGRIKTGASILSALSALRVGAGLVTLCAPVEQSIVYRLADPSLMIEDYEQMARFKEHFQDERRNVIAIGMGAGLENPAALKKAILDSCQVTPARAVVIDADALTVFSDQPKVLFSATHSFCVLTPHEGEFQSLFPDISAQDISRSEKVAKAAKRAGCSIVLKGSETIIATEDGQVFALETQAPWLATAGSGDVLAGMIAGLLARNIGNFLETLCLAVELHGMAGRELGAGLIASDIPKVLPQIFEDIALSFEKKTEKNRSHSYAA